jgi:hypothetical protein
LSPSIFLLFLLNLLFNDVSSEGRWRIEHSWNDTDRIKLMWWGEKSSPLTLSITDVTLTVLGSNPGFRGERLADRHPIPGTATYPVACLHK